MVLRAEAFIRENAGVAEFRAGDVTKAAFASVRAAAEELPGRTGNRLATPFAKSACGARAPSSRR